MENNNNIPGEVPVHHPNNVNIDIPRLEEQLSDIRVAHKEETEKNINCLICIVSSTIMAVSVPLIVCNFYYYNKIKNDNCLLEFNKQLLSTYFLVFGIHIVVYFVLSLMILIAFLFKICQYLSNEEVINKIKFFGRLNELALFGFHVAFFVYFAGNVSRTGGNTSIYEDLNKCYNGPNNMSDMSAYCIVIFILSCINFIAKILKKK